MSNNIPLIAHVIYRFDMGGLENGLVNLINGLPTTEFRHSIICIDNYTNFSERIERKDVEVYAINKKPGTDFFAVWRIYRLLRRLRPDIVHSRNLAGLDAILPALFAGIKTRIHGEHGWDINDVDGGNWKLQRIRQLYRPFINHYIALSRDIEHYLTAKIGVRPTNISRISNGVDTRKFQPCGAENRAHIRVKFGMDVGPQQTLIGTVGRLQEVKSQTLLVDAFIRIVEQSPELADSLRLAIVGAGPMRNQIIQRLEAANLRDLCWIPGARNDVPEILQAMDIFVLPSLAEGISNTILEAMACGIPVVATRVGGNAELVLNGTTGCIVDDRNPQSLAEAIELYVRSPDLRHLHGRHARHRVEQEFSIDIMIKSYKDLYRSLANEFH